MGIFKNSIRHNLSFRNHLFMRVTKESSGKRKAFWVLRNNSLKSNATNIEIRGHDADNRLNQQHLKSSGNNFNFKSLLLNVPSFASSSSSSSKNCTQMNSNGGHNIDQSFNRFDIFIHMNKLALLKVYSLVI